MVFENIVSPFSMEFNALCHLLFKGHRSLEAGEWRMAASR